MSAAKRDRTFKGGKWRLKCIREAVQRDDLETLRARCARRRKNFGEFVRLDAPEVLQAWSFSLWHDAEYALSIAEGYYDPKSPINAFVRNQMAERGHELTMDELLSYRIGIMEHMGPCLAKHKVPVEYGCCIRLMRSSMKAGAA